MSKIQKPAHKMETKNVKIKIKSSAPSKNSADKTKIKDENLNKKVTKAKETTNAKAKNVNPKTKEVIKKSSAKDSSIKNKKNVAEVNKTAEQLVMPMPIVKKKKLPSIILKKAYKKALVKKIEELKTPVKKSSHKKVVVSTPSTNKVESKKVVPSKKVVAPKQEVKKVEEKQVESKKTDPSKKVIVPKQEVKKVEQKQVESKKVVPSKKVIAPKQEVKKVEEKKSEVKKIEKKKVIPSAKKIDIEKIISTEPEISKIEPKTTDIEKVTPKKIKKIKIQKVVAEEPKPITFIKPKTNVRYSDADLEEFRILIENNKKEVIEELQTLYDRIEDFNNIDFSESSTYSMHMAEQGSDAMEKEKTYNLIQRQKELLQKLNSALERVKDKTFGICRVCGCLIAKERLLAVPTTTLSASYKLSGKCPDDGIDAIRKF